MSWQAAIRPATPGDVSAMAAILAVTDEPIDWPGLPGFPYLEHLLRRAGVAVAVAADGSVVGFGGAIDIGPAGGPRVGWLTDLFVLPDRQSGGTGSDLLEAVLAGFDHRMTESSSDRRALALYIRAGMHPWWPHLYVAGEVTGLPRLDTALRVEPAGAVETAAWAQGWTGRDRQADFEYFTSLPEAAGFVIHDAGQVAAVGWARRERDEPRRWLEHVAIAPDADPVRAALAAFRAAAPDGGRVGAIVPGPHPALPALLEHGVRILDNDTFCATDPGLLDPTRILPNAGFL